ncbi:MAG: hypothetical protein IKP73_19800 [Bacteroidales bacterium]|jgi:3-oxoacyl-[acyl-carrier-protein] synthase-1|nr:hypothetical protein [Bacteroidales bacterium]
MIENHPFSYIYEGNSEYCSEHKKVHISPSQVAESNFLTAVYRSLGCNYPKFFKMDDLSKAGFLVAEMAIGAYKKELDPKTTGVVFFDRKASLSTDCIFAKTIADADNFFPSPSVFVYTLPNIVSGEVCIRHGFQGESAFYVLKEQDGNQIQNICQDMLVSNSAVVCGWVDFVAGDVFARAEIFTAEDFKS